MRSTFNLWSTVLAETRKLSRERASLAETYASEMIARLDIIVRDVHMLSKKVCTGRLCYQIKMAGSDRYQYIALYMGSCLSSVTCAVSVFWSSTANWTERLLH